VLYNTALPTDGVERVERGKEKRQRGDTHVAWIRNRDGLL
jgi:hypothetical protein